MTISWVCVDASLVVKLVVEEPYSEFWTADERLVNAVQADLPWIKWIGQPIR